MKRTDAQNGILSPLKNITLDLGEYKARLDFQNEDIPLEIHFDKPSRRFYFSLLCLIVNEMKEKGRPEFVYIRKYEKVLSLLDKSLAGANASKTADGMWDKIRKAWRHRLPDLETGSLFRVLNRNYIGPYEKGGKFRYDCSDLECDVWANFFEHDLNNPWRIKFAIDSAGLDLKDISIIFGDLRDNEAWQEYTNRLKIQHRGAGRRKQAVPAERRKPFFALAITLAVVLLITAIWNIYFRNVEPTLQHADSEKITIAVLPFVNISGDPEQEYFSDGITDDLITDLSKISGIYVISRNSTFTFKGKSVKAQQIAKELGVRYILEGSVRKAGDKVRINTQLIDTSTDHHLWAERYDGKLDDIFGLQDRITSEVVARLAIKLTANDLSQLSQRETDNIEAYEAYLQGMEHQHRDTMDHLVKAVSSFKKAIDLDPEYSEAHAALSLAYQHISGRRWDVDLGWRNSRILAQKHLDIAMRNPTSLALRMKSRALLFYERNHKEAIAQATKALKLDPNGADNLFYLARALSFSGRHAESLQLYEKAMRLNPYYPSWYPQHYGIALYCLEQFGEAAKMQERALRVNPHTSAWWIAATYAQLGQDDRAADLLNAYVQKRGWNLPYVESTFRYWPFKDQIDLERFAKGLAMAGLPRPGNPAYRRKYSEAFEQADRNITLNPEDPNAYRDMAESLILAGKATQAMEFINRAIRLEPDNLQHLYTLGLAQFCLRRYEAAATSLEAFSMKNMDHIPGWLLAATYALDDRQDLAQKALNDHLETHKLVQYSIEKVINTYLYAFKDPGIVQQFVQGLGKAGLPSEKKINPGN